MAVNYEVLADAKSVVLEKTGLAEPNDLDNLLTISAGQTNEDSPTTVYRPYYVAAYLLRTRVFQLEKGEGAEFANPFAVANEYMRLQRDIDNSMNLIVPSGSEAIVSNSFISAQMIRDF